MVWLFGHNLPLFLEQLRFQASTQPKKCFQSGILHIVSRYSYLIILNLSQHLNFFIFIHTFKFGVNGSGSLIFRGNADRMRLRIWNILEFSYLFVNTVLSIVLYDYSGSKQPRFNFYIYLDTIWWYYITKVVMMVTQKLGKIM